MDDMFELDDPIEESSKLIFEAYASVFEKLRTDVESGIRYAEAGLPKEIISCANSIIRAGSLLNLIMTKAPSISTPNGTIYNPFGVQVDDGEAEMSVDELKLFLDDIKNNSNNINIIEALSVGKKTILDKHNEDNSPEEVDW